MSSIVLSILLSIWFAIHLLDLWIRIVYLGLVLRFHVLILKVLILIREKWFMLNLFDFFSLLFLNLLKLALILIIKIVLTSLLAQMLLSLSLLFILVILVLRLLNWWSMLRNTSSWFRTWLSSSLVVWRCTYVKWYNVWVIIIITFLLSQILLSHLINSLLFL